MVPHVAYENETDQTDGRAESGGRKNARRRGCATSCEAWYIAYGIAAAACIAWLLVGCSATGFKAGAEINARGAGAADSVTFKP